MKGIAARVGKLRKHFGIAAPKMAVQTKVAWYWRWMGIALLFAISAATATWIYDAGRRFAGFDSAEVNQELRRMSTELDSARAELASLRTVANAAESRLAIERAAQQKLAQQVRDLQQENAEVREELATLESMLSLEGRDAKGTLSIYRLDVAPEALPGEYRYRVLLVTPRSRRDRDFKGRMELVVSLSEGGRSAMITFPEREEAGAAAFRLAFRYFRRVEGIFRVSPAARVESVQVRIYEAGSNEPRATHSVTL